MLTARAQHVVVQAAGPRMQHVVTAARATNKHSKHRNQTQMPAHQQTSDTDTCDTFRVASSMSWQWWWQSWEESDEHTTDWSSARASTEDAGRSSQRQRTLAAHPNAYDNQRRRQTPSAANRQTRIQQLESEAEQSAHAAKEAKACRENNKKMKVAQMIAR